MLLPCAAFLLNVSSQHLAVLPAGNLLGRQEAKNQGEASQPLFKILAGNLKLGVLNESDVNTTVGADADRLGAFWNVTLRRIASHSPGFTCKLNTDFMEDSYEFITKNISLTKSHPAQVKGTWPPERAPLTLSKMAEKKAFLAVYVIKEMNQSGALEKVDFVLFDKESTQRAYVSRGLQDPQFKQSATEFLGRASQQFAKALAPHSIAPKTGDTFRILVGKNFSESDFTQIEGVLRQFTENKSLALTPIEVDKNTITYTSNIASDLKEQITQKTKEEAPEFVFRFIDAEIPTIQVIKQTVKQKSK